MPVDAVQYPVNLVLVGRRCLVVGGGSIAARKVAGLLECGAHVHVVATRVGPQVRGLEERRGLEAGEGERVVTWEERPYRRGEVSGYRLVIAATDDPRVNRAVYTDAEGAGVWVNSADDPAACSFTLPSVLRRGPVMVTVSTAGHSPALATWLRSRLSEQLGPEYAVLAELLSEARDQLKGAGRSTEGLDWRGALDADLLELIRAGRRDEARSALRRALGG